MLPRNLLSQLAGQQLQLDPKVMQMGLADRLAGQAAIENTELASRIITNIEGDATSEQA